MFTQNTLDFLEENYTRNDREWFQAHKAQYKEYVVKPFGELIGALAPSMLDIDEFFLVRADPEKSVSRIWRDMRFARNTSFFKQAAWCCFSRDTKLYNGYPTYYLEISPHRFRYGCGYYQASSSALRQMRELILNRDSAYLDAKSAAEKQSVFLLEGESFKRPKFPHAPAEDQDWLNRKGLHFCCSRTDMNALFQDGLVEKLKEDFLRIAPIYHFFIKAEMLARAEAPVDFYHKDLNSPSFFYEREF